MDGITYIEDEEPDPYTEEERRALTPTDAEYGDLTGAPAMDPDDMGATAEAIDKYIGAQLELEADGKMQHGKVVGRAKDSSGKNIGRAHNNPMFDTREYMVKFPDESIRQYTANQIVQSIYSSIDSEGN